ncbi:serine threonine protein kinase : Serine/threonine protein kinase OS=Pirellula staleyi (strain ATCC 27377 / DSM 6068 / ICPB 4128) GN=Psta_4559 PE=3 SV=1: Pkinase: DJ-1_PfpI [Gemmataceae bacterium]|nr:serine threonine protein kinase : Serine/threonine protein kinase OS=Pirellula staleyi (strain ATCC 27377 / DSM 6068 / ICPB 4128) GN=Psta_4559 PE=3 SV=1: Pkinase: DJ-1_PfpI [Gemmataceae bacterium]VTU00241.1 serine threonine protein kinase : Serine/threonine protein kinase OS=Pirellula staleyi (strain ATCC 27377 / DSM 6068 / ICPB 4128) GN=Psta_4559 PE=3 SV=1: Pkinase: DJ-1_PfpI [Gemmataceae bacterium]
MAVATHPTPDALAAFARGDLPATELAVVAEHIATCSACCSVISRVPDDSLAGLARQAAALADKTPECAATPAATRTVVEPHGSGPATVGDDDGIPAPLRDHPRYEVIRELGAGGMGVVYKAEHRIMGRPVALKVMAPHLTAKPGAVERFRKEVRAAAQINHPNIVTAHDADEAGGLHFLVMEFVEGVSLDRFVAKKGPATVQLAAAFTRQAALGLQHAHEKGMVHRDIKPQNMMVTRKGQVKVMDFGLARFVHTDDEDGAAGRTAPGGRLPFGAGRPVADPVTNPNLLMGTPDYLSPEQAKNSHAVDSRSDIYSLGCTLFFLLVGKPPFAAAPSLIDKLLAHTEQPPPDVRELRPDVPEGLAAVLDKMLAKKPDDRFDTAGDVAVALQPFVRAATAEVEPRFEALDGATAPASGVGLPRVADVETLDTEPAARERTLVEEQRPRKKKAKRQKARPWYAHPAAKIGAVAAGLMLVALVIAATGKNKPEPTAPAPDVTPGPVASATQTRTDKKPPLGITDPNPKWPNGEEKKFPLFPKKEPPFPPGKGPLPLPLLYVLPSDGLWGPDFGPVVSQLRQHGVRVAVATGQGGHATFMRNGPNDPLRSVPVDVRVENADAANYSGVMFCGYNVSEYVEPKNGDYTLPKQTRDLIKRFNDAGKPIGAICVGERVLVVHGLLKSKAAAKSEMLQKDFPGLAAEKTITWTDERVVVAGNVVTAGGDRDATAFADAMAKLVARPE